MSHEAHSEHESSDESRSSSGHRHDVDSAGADADTAASAGDVGGRDGSQGEQDGQREARQLAESADTVEVVDEILDGEIAADAREPEIMQESWHGPLPSPPDLAAYEHVLPGAADRVLAMAERQVGIREERERTVRAAVDGEVSVQTTIAGADRDALKRGQWQAWSIAMTVTAVSFGGMFLTPWAVFGFVVPLAQIAATLVRTVSDGHNPSPAVSNSQLNGSGQGGDEGSAGSTDPRE